MKHLGAAAALEIEVTNGYPHYGPYMWGHMEQAEEEIAALHGDLSRVIRAHRVAAQYNTGHSVPFDALIEFLFALEGVRDDEAERLAVPAACLRGLEKDEDGNTLFPEDTRR